MGGRFEVQGVGAATPLGEAAPLILRSKAAPLFDLEPVVRTEADEESVHGMRVASRRMREAMRLLAPLYRRRTLDPWKDRVRTITRTLGPVRDADVFVEAIGTLSSGLSGGGRRAVAFLVGYSLGRRERDLELLRAGLSEIAIGGERQSFERAASRVRDADISRRPLSWLAHSAIRARVDEVVVRQQQVCADGDDDQHHALRIAYKRLRYATEVFMPCYGSRFDGLYDVLSAYQDALGDLHDAQVFSAVIADRYEDGSVARAGVRGSDIDAVHAALVPRADEARGRFTRLVEKHPAESLRRELLAPFTDQGGAPCV